MPYTSPVSFLGAIFLLVRARTRSSDLAYSQQLQPGSWSPPLPCHLLIEIVIRLKANLLKLPRNNIRAQWAVSDVRSFQGCRPCPFSPPWPLGKAGALYFTCVWPTLSESLSTGKGSSDPFSRWNWKAIHSLMRLITKEGRKMGNFFCKILTSLGISHFCESGRWG